MTHRKARIARTAAVLFAAAVVVLGGGVPASADITTAAKVTGPTQSQVISGSFDSDGTPKDFKVTLKGSGATNCQSGWQRIRFSVSGGPSDVAAFADLESGSPSWSGAHPKQWDTQSLENGVYTVRLDMTEKTTSGLLDNCPSSSPGSTSGYVTVKVANPARAPVWASDPSPAANGTANVTLRWHKSDAVDAREYHIVRTGPDGTKIAPVNAGSPGGQGCSVSSGVYTCQDKSFSSAYTGTYTYVLVTLRERPAYNSSEDDKIQCATVSKPCVVSAGSPTRSVSLVAPTPTPTPTPSDEPSTPGTPSGTPSSRPSSGSGTGSGSGRGGTRVLSFGSSSDFYSGTYSETLPYSPKTLILGGGSATSSPQAQGYQGDVVSETAPDYRTIMLPVAGGLLAFLSAAHVRRLMLHL